MDDLEGAYKAGRKKERWVKVPVKEQKSPFLGATKAVAVASALEIRVVII